MRGRFGHLAWILLVVFSAHAQVQVRFVDEAKVRQRLETNARKTEDREGILKSLFEDAGCGAGLSEEKVGGSKAPNLICTMPGETEDQIVVGAHFDQVAMGQGIVDNWSGASLLASLYESLVGKPRQHTILFIGFTEEERGLAGSKSYVQRRNKEELSRIRAMVNIDSIGLGPTKVGVSTSHAMLVAMAAAIGGKLKLPVNGMNFDKVGRTDAASFSDRKIAVIDFHSLSQETWPILHTPRDRMAAIDRAAYYESYKLITGFVAWLDRNMPDFKKKKK